MRPTSSWMTVLGCVVYFAQAAAADGGFFATHAGNAQSSDQQAIVVFDNGRQTMVIQTAYDGNQSDFAWVIPIPVVVTADDIGTVSAEIFRSLYHLTEPVALSGGGGGCGCPGGSSSHVEEAGAGVYVWERLRIDGYEIAVLSAQDSADLRGWLDDNDYALPEHHQGELDYYVNKSWHFMAVKISPASADDVSASDGQTQQVDSMPPVRVSFDTPEPVYPLRMSAVSSTSEVQVLLYVIARHRMTSSSHETREVQLVSDFAGADFPAYYDGQFRANLRLLGPGALLVEYAMPLDAYFRGRHAADLGLTAGDWYLTRLRTYVEPAHMDSDIVMEQAGSDDPFAVRVAISTDRDIGSRFAALGMIAAIAGALGLAVGSRRGLLMAVAFAMFIGLMVF